jgi:Cu(I)/Ag(I) efflux system membrane fusion protein
MPPHDLPNGPPVPRHFTSPSNNPEGGLRAPPNLGFWGKAWWWFHFLILVKLARLRFVAVLVAIGLVIVKWDAITAHYERWTRPAGTEHAHNPDTEYFCPMHPAIVRDNPKEKCPICFMPLSKRKKGDHADEALPPGVVSRVQLTPYRVVLAGVETWRVAYVPLTKEIATVGSVEFDERLMRHLAARVKGRIDQLVVNETGQMVEKGDVLASIYSPDLVVTVQNLLDARAGKNADLERVARERLRLWDIDEAQIAAILKAGKPVTHLTIRSPITGHVARKYVKEGQYVEEGAPLYEIVDLATVWILGQVYEDDMAFLPAQSHFHRQAADPAGTLPVTATTRAFPDEVFSGRLTFVYPHVDADTHTVAVRLELPNPDHKLRPGTTANVKIQVPPDRVPLFGRDAAERAAQEALAGALLASLAPLPVAAPLPPVGAAGRAALLGRGMLLAVPDTAVIDTGTLKIVYRQALPGVFDGVQVALGPRMLGPGGVSYYPVLHGLKDGDVIVTAGSFLIDAETRLNPAAGSIYFGGSAGKGPGGGTVRPSTPEDEDAKVKAAIAALPTEEDRQRALAQGYCPVLKNNRLGSMGVPFKLVLGKETVFLCCSGCEEKAKKSPAEILKTVEQLRIKGAPATLSAEDAEIEAEIKTALARLSPEDRRLAEVQKYCPVRNERLGSMGVPKAVTIDGQRFFVCCSQCIDRAEKGGKQTLKKVQELRAKGK